MICIYILYVSNKIHNQLLWALCLIENIKGYFTDKNWLIKIGGNKELSFYTLNDSTNTNNVLHWWFIWFFLSIVIKL